ncbi:hypothetical protein K456DRAFT_1759698 [Colletotrichum gloeosporioides 23]|nr:hypothetical protein K456DRAFT_1759698 [Colletotrichum gloeosporioides 23]
MERSPGRGSCGLLASLLLPASTAMIDFSLSLDSRSHTEAAVASEIGARLYLISRSKSFHVAANATYEQHVDETIEQSATCLLFGLYRLFRNSHHFFLPTTLLDTRNIISRLLQPKAGAEAKRNLFALFHDNLTIPRHFQHQCNVLHGLIDGRAEDYSGVYSNVVPRDWGLPDHEDIPSHVPEDLLYALNAHTTCIEPSHGLEILALPPSKKIRHPTRLCLARSHQSTAICRCARFDIVTSKDGNFWHDHYINILWQSDEPTQRLMLNAVDEEEFSDKTCKLVKEGDLCGMLNQAHSVSIGFYLDQQKNLRRMQDFSPRPQPFISGEGVPLSVVLQEYTLSTRDKVELAYIISKAWWRFHPYEAFERAWTSSNIWLMPIDSGESGIVLPVQVYVPVNYDDNDNEIPECISGEYVNHLFPRILSLGIVLLEIGLGQPFQRHETNDLVERINENCNKAIRKLRHLKDTTWEGFPYDSAFTDAIQWCLDSKNIRITTERARRFRERTMKTPETSQSIRLELVLNHVVTPLAYLAISGFHITRSPVSYLSKANNTDTDPSPALVPQHAEFHAENFTGTAGWMEDIKLMNCYIARLYRQTQSQSLAPVKIAVLDTGIDPRITFFDRDGRKEMIKCCRDFVGENSESELGISAMKDVSGHGSFMTWLMMESAPLAEIYVARVAEHSETLGSRAKAVAKAIEWAGIEKYVDIISMSFGMEHDESEITTAVARLNQIRPEGCILLSSAGNSGASQPRESFPSRLPDVIGIYATDREGRFLASNPSVKESFCLGTFGDDVSRFIIDDMRHHFGQHIGQRGSSIATAVAAGIVASTLAYASIVPLHLSLSESPESNLRLRLSSTRAMRNVLKRMTPSHESVHQKFINPIWFWSKKSKNIERYCALYDWAEQE